jgi:nitrogen fixation protein NifU and related proteins
MSYSDKVIDHYNNPRNVGSMDKSSADVGTGLVGAPECGDVMKLQIKVNRETNVIEEAKFKTFGCGSAIASSSLATEWVKGKTVDEALTIKNMDIVKELSLPPVKIHCSVLAEDAIRAAIGDWKKKQESREAGYLRGSAVSVVERRASRRARLRRARPSVRWRLAAEASCVRNYDNTE